GRANAPLRGSGDVVGIGGLAVSGDLPQDGSATSLGVFQAFQYQNPPPFTDHQPIPIFIKRLGGSLASFRGGARLLKPPDSTVKQDMLSAAGKGSDHFTSLDGAVGLPDGVVPASAGSRDGGGWALDAVINRQHSRCSIGH